MYIRSALSKTQEQAVETKAGATVLVQSQNKEIGLQKAEIDTLKTNMADVQDKYEDMRLRYHTADKNNGILNVQMRFFAGIEFIKFGLSTVGTGYGVNLLSSGDKSGIFYILGSGAAYLAITTWQRPAKQADQEGNELQG